VETVFSKAAQNDATKTGAVTQTNTYRGQITLQGSTGIVIDGTDKTAAGFASSAGVLAFGGTLDQQNVKSVDNANNTVLSVDAALKSVSDLRSNFGAIQNRFESTIANIQTGVENITASRSRIMDADFAAETATLSRNQILQQAGTAMLAQANQLPQNVLSLLR
jgi:flagellin